LFDAYFYFYNGKNALTFKNNFFFGLKYFIFTVMPVKSQGNFPPTLAQVHITLMSANYRFDDCVCRTLVHASKKGKKRGIGACRSIFRRLKTRLFDACPPQAGKMHF
jgi:hypothetical protein